LVSFIESTDTNYPSRDKFQAYFPYKDNLLIITDKISFMGSWTPD